MEPSSQSYEIEIVANPKPVDVATVKEGLAAYNMEHAEDGRFEPLTLFIRSIHGSVIGGVLGGTYWGYLNIDTLWVSDKFRSRGLGTQLLNTAEREAVSRGCRYAHLDTHSFQNFSFYLRHGYKVVGELKELPPGHSRYLLCKTLTPMSDVDIDMRAQGMSDD